MFDYRAVIHLLTTQTQDTSVILHRSHHSLSGRDNTVQLIRLRLGFEWRAAALQPMPPPFLLPEVLEGEHYLGIESVACTRKSKKLSNTLEDACQFPLAPFGVGPEGPRVEPSGQKCGGQLLT